jgi:hypothetical protein
VLYADALLPLEITLSSAQLKKLAAVAEQHPHSLTIRNEGDSFLFLDLHDARGMVVNRFRMPYDDQDLVQVAS